jgi:hypothetical protein
VHAQLRQRGLTIAGQAGFCSWLVLQAPAAGCCCCYCYPVYLPLDCKKTITIMMSVQHSVSQSGITSVGRHPRLLLPSWQSARQECRVAGCCLPAHLSSAKCNDAAMAPWPRVLHPLHKGPSLAEGRLSLSSTADSTNRLRVCKGG